MNLDEREQRWMEGCVLFAYSHNQITEGCAMTLLRLDRLSFRDRWIDYLKKNPEVAIATGHDLHLVV